MHRQLVWEVVFPLIIHKKSCRRYNKNKEPTTDFLLCAVAFKNMSVELLTAIRIAFHITSLKQTKALSTISGRALNKAKKALSEPKREVFF